MTATKRGLGRGLSALIPDDDMEFLSRIARGVQEIVPVSGERDRRRGASKIANSLDSPAAEDEDATPSQDSGPMHLGGGHAAEWITTTHIEPNPYQPRRFFGEDEMQELINSVREHGILQPILVRPLSMEQGQTRYQLVAGERRWRAAQQAGLEQVPAIVRAVADQQALELALIENVQRRDISAVDADLSYRRLATEFHLSQEDIARRVGKSRSAVANTMRLLDLPSEAQKAIEDGVISEGHGRAILLASGDGSRRAIFRRILRDKLSVREVERLAQSLASSGEVAGGLEGQPASISTESTGLSSSGKHTNQDADSYHVASLLQKALGARVQVRSKGKGGKILIEYSSSEELRRLLDVLSNQQR